MKSHQVGLTLTPNWISYVLEDSRWIGYTFGSYIYSRFQRVRNSKRCLSQDFRTTSGRNFEQLLLYNLPFNNFFSVASMYWLEEIVQLGAMHYDFLQEFRCPFNMLLFLFFLCFFDAYSSQTTAFLTIYCCSISSRLCAPYCFWKFVDLVVLHSV